MKLLFMNAIELRSLDAWIAENVFGWTDIEFYKPPQPDYTEEAPEPFWRGVHKANLLWQSVPRYTTDPAASDALDDAILNHPMGNHRIELVNGIYYFTSTVNPNIGCEHAEKKICRALFAQKIWTK